ncbi:Urea Transporter 2 [Manis pentadactyla]|nr:Urea Transporter 2 [Manis pentadactyla]
MEAEQDDHLAGMVLEDPSKEKLRTENEHVVLEGSEFINRYRKNMKLGVDHEVKLFSCWNHFLSLSLS